MLVNDVLKILNKRIIPSIKWKDDPVGLLVGNKSSEVRSILVSLNPTIDVVEEAVEKKCNLIVTHHPLFKNPLKKLIHGEYYSDIISMMIKNDISFIACHTNYDLLDGGVSHLLAGKFNLKNIKPLIPLNEISGVEVTELFKIVVYVPSEFEDQIKETISSNGGASIGNYDHVFFQTKGESNFRPGKNSSPFIGTKGVIERVNEIKIETVVPSWKLNELIEKVKSVHPYEEPVIDIFKLENLSGNFGLGVIGDLEYELSLKEFAQNTEKYLNTKTLRIASTTSKKIKKVAVCGGNGSSYWKHAYMAGADLYLTSEFGHHLYQEASKYIHIIDATHHATEIVASNGLFDYLSNEILDNRIILSEVDKDPVISVDEI
ncbi:MAG: Nif3-like dinuclear metal center hexameric protein [Candidatus Delongbacteria bacterium]|nr:Nif3-like dinuclear metal center hexameric protein [Candidatus Delongbacteria bacterium]